MSSDHRDPPRTFALDPATKAAVERMGYREYCHCLAARGKTGTPSVPNIHSEPQDASVVGWTQIVEIVRSSARAGSAVLEPTAKMPWDDWIRVITLPPDVYELQAIKDVRLYGSHLRRLPPEVGRMAALENLDIYRSYSLHWLPYEVTRCANLRQSRMSTRALYGNMKTRLPFPRLSGPMDALLPSTCSVCDRSFGSAAPRLYWITLRVGTDIVPLLVHSCSDECTKSIPTPPDGYFDRPHQGGGGVGMPKADA